MAEDDYDDGRGYVDDHNDLVRRVGELERVVQNLIEMLRSEPALHIEYRAAREGEK